MRHSMKVVQKESFWYTNQFRVPGNSINKI